MAEMNERPFPPGDYPLVVVGSGPGAIQISYSLTKLGIGHAVISADEAPGGMFRRWPFFQRLLSWTKPYAPAVRGSRTYERYDWNSLISDEPEHRALMPTFMDGSSYFPSRPEMELNLAAFAERTRVRIRYGCRWTATSHEDGADGGRFVLETSDGQYRAPVAVFAVGVAEPHTPPFPGSELARHYAETRAAETYADRRIFIIGKQVSAFELATGFLQWAKQLILASPSPTKLSVDTRSLVGVRARYVQPYEDHVLGGGVVIIDASIERIESQPDGGLVVTTRPSAGGGELRFEVDDVISATGFVCPLLDLPDLGVATFGQSRLPAQTPFWESATVPGIYFAGTIGQGSKGLQKHGIPSNSGAVQGSRYNARCLAGHIARARFGIEAPRPSLPPRDLLDFVADQLTDGPEAWNQKAYLAHVVSFDPDDGIRDEGIVPLSWFVDASGPNALGITLESDGSGDVYPVLYSRLGGRVSERRLDPHPVLDYRTASARKAIAEVLSAFGAGT